MLEFLKVNAKEWEQNWTLSQEKAQPNLAMLFHKKKRALRNEF